MPITAETVTLEYKLLPVTLNPDGSSLIYLRKGYTLSGEFVVIENITHLFSPLETQTMLAQMPTPGLSRLDDLTGAIYQALVAAGVASGIIS